MTVDADASARLVAALRDARCYEHPVDRVDVIETHISWVLLAGPYAYKLKKPLDLGFVDFSTLAKRRRCCEDELRLNRRLAPELYLDVVPVAGSPDRPALGGAGRPLDYLVKMRRFRQRDLLDAAARNGTLTRAHVDQIAAQIAAFHAAAAVAGPDHGFGDADAVARWAEQNFAQIAPLLADAADLTRLDRLRRWSRDRWRGLRALMAARKTQGWVRDCHGDLHLGNMALIDGRVTVFDCIEFNDELRVIDVCSEIAFLVMDLYDHGRGDFAHRFLDGYLTALGDYAGLRLLRFYAVYRALVRAKVSLLSAYAQDADDASRARALAGYRGYAALASDAFAERPGPALVVCCGLSGSGKSALSAELVERLHGVRARTDVERKRLAGLRADAASGSAPGAGLYTADLGERTYARVADCAGAALDGGFIAIADGTFLRREQRQRLRREARRRRLDCLFVETCAPPALLRERIEQRRRERPLDPSEATPRVLDGQIAAREPFADDERAETLSVDTAALRPAAAAELVAERLGAARAALV